MPGLLTLLLWLIVIVAIFGVAWWALSQIPLPPPFRVVVNIVFAVVAVIVLIWLATTLLGGPPHVSRLTAGARWFV